MIIMAEKPQTNTFEVFILYLPYDMSHMTQATPPLSQEASLSISGAITTIIPTRFPIVFKCCLSASTIPLSVQVKTLAAPLEKLFILIIKKRHQMK